GDLVHDLGRVSGVESDDRCLCAGESRGLDHGGDLPGQRRWLPDDPGARGLAACQSSPQRWRSGRRRHLARRSNGVMAFGCAGTLETKRRTKMTKQLGASPAADRPKSDAESLAGIEIFRELPRDAVAALSRRCRWRRYRPNETILKCQDAGRDVFFVV